MWSLTAGGAVEECFDEHDPIFFVFFVFFAVQEHTRMCTNTQVIQCTVLPTVSQRSAVLQPLAVMRQEMQECASKMQGGRKPPHEASTHAF